jgi:Sfi1 spindle body protein
MQWHAKFLRVRKNKRQLVLDQHLSQKRSKITKHCFSSWRLKSNDVRALQDMAEEIRHDRDLDLLGGTFLHWNERAVFLETLQIRATDHHNITLLRYIPLCTLLTNLGDILPLGELASTEWMNSRISLRIISPFAVKMLLRNISDHGGCAYFSSAALQCNPIFSDNDPSV